MNRMPSRPSPRFPDFRRANCVHSPIHGFGQVLVGGRLPLVRFLDGPETLVPAEELSFISNERFAEEIANRTRIDNATLVWAYGRDALRKYGEHWRQDEAGIWTTSPPQLADSSHPPGVDNVFLADDIGQDARVLTTEEARERTDVVDCVVTRPPSRCG